MKVITQLKQAVLSGEFHEAFSELYGEPAVQEQTQRYCAAADAYVDLYSETEAAFFSAPGRTEIGGNHTDHQQGRVLAAGVNLDVIAVAGKNDSGIIRIQSKGYRMDTIDLTQLDIVEEEKNKAISLIRGTAARFVQLGYRVGGFQAYTTSNVLKGSGLSSSAAFEVLVGTMLNHLYNEGSIDPVTIAQIGQYAENVYFDKPCGLMDQTASAVGGFVTIDFEHPQTPVVEKVEFDFAAQGYSLCIVDTGGNHTDLTDDYAAVPREMKQVAAQFGKSFLREVAPQEFYARLPRLRQVCDDRSLLRAIHFFADNDIVPKEVQALKNKEFEEFKQLIIASGRSSFMYLQNVFTTKSPGEQGVSLALALSDHMLRNKGAWRVHGGGFAGTIQAFVPDFMLAGYKENIEAVFGSGSCHVLSIRRAGGIEVTPDLNSNSVEL